MELVRARVQTQSFELDQLQQYSRRDNIWVYGIEETADECMNTIIVKVAHDLGGRGDLGARAEREPPIRQKDGQQIGVCKNETQRRCCYKDLERHFTSTQLNSFGTKQHMQFDYRRTHQKYSIIIDDKKIDMICDDIANNPRNSGCTKRVSDAITLGLPPYSVMASFIVTTSAEPAS